MREYFLSTRIPKILGNNENEILEQLEKVEQIISELSKIDPILRLGISIMRLAQNHL